MKYLGRALVAMGLVDIVLAGASHNVQAAVLGFIGACCGLFLMSSSGKS